MLKFTKGKEVWVNNISLTETYAVFPTYSIGIPRSLSFRNEYLNTMNVLDSLNSGTKSLECFSQSRCNLWTWPRIIPSSLEAP